MKTGFTTLLLLMAVAFAGMLAVRAADSGPTPRVIKIRAGVGNVVKFDVTSISAAPGEPIQVVLTNAGTLPKTIMGHNWILLTAGSDPIAFATAAATEPDTGYIPTKLKGEIVAFIALQGPGETGEVTFQAPREPGQYPFLCSVPGHAIIGMKGVLVVTK